MRLKIKLDFDKEITLDQRLELEQHLTLAINERNWIPKYKLAFGWKKNKGDK